MKILSLDTTGSTSTCALLEDEVIVGSFSVQVPLTQSETAIPMVQNLLKETQTFIEEIDVYAVANGPGSFTGVRIGVSAIKAMAMAMKKPCIGISTLEGLATNLEGFDGVIIPALDARRKQVYTAAFCWNNGKLEQIEEDQAIDSAVFSEKIKKLEKPIYLLGDGSYLLKEQLKFCAYTPEDLLFQKASSIAKRAYYYALNMPEKLVSSKDLDIRYLRLSQAERERQEREKGI